MTQTLFLAGLKICVMDEKIGPTKRFSLHFGEKPGQKPANFFFGYNFANFLKLFYQFFKRYLCLFIHIIDNVCSYLFQSNQTREKKVFIILFFHLIYFTCSSYNWDNGI
jgi:hypothetical protein